MRKQDWRNQTFALSWLRERQDDERQGVTTFGVHEWLIDIGVVPAHVTSIKWSQVQPILNLDGDHIRAGYIAAVAAEWDSWGSSTPTQFLDALELETAGNTRRDVIAELLHTLGQAVETDEDLRTRGADGRYDGGRRVPADSVADISYNLRLPKGHAA